MPTLGPCEVETNAAGGTLQTHTDRPLSLTNEACSTYVVRPATDEDRRTIYRIRHDVYAGELQQHRCNAVGELRDDLDEFNDYIVVRRNDVLTGFVAITPPTGPRYSLDKYLDRAQWPFPIDAGLYEVRLLTVIPQYRAGPTAMLLMHAAQRYLEQRQATRAIAIGRRDVLGLYLRVGFRRLGPSFLSGAVRYDLLSVDVVNIPTYTSRFEPTLRSLQSRICWDLECPYLQQVSEELLPTTSPAQCIHGGASIAAIGAGFETLDRRHDVINADVLDAWFPPAPEVVTELQRHLDWLLRTSPPTDCGGLIDEIARRRGVRPECLVPGAGSSDLIFRALPRWLTSGSKVLLLDPTYGEYRHVLQHVVGCRVDSCVLQAEEGFIVNLDRLARQLESDYDLVVIVNPNNPTGALIPRTELEALLQRVQPETRIWIDEAYIDFAGPDQSLEQFVVGAPHAVVCKSLSKSCALSGARVAYLCGSPPLIEDLRSVTPPWVVGLPSQFAAVLALRNPAYYAQQYDQTRQLRIQLQADLEAMGLHVWPGVANFLLCRLPEHSLEAAELIARCRHRGLFLRDVSSMTSRPDRLLFRIAVKDHSTNARMLEILREELPTCPHAPQEAQ